jgi:hypothetical protein
MKAFLYGVVIGLLTIGLAQNRFGEFYRNIQ